MDIVLQNQEFITVQLFCMSFHCTLKSMLEDYSGLNSKISGRRLPPIFLIV